MNPGTYLTFKAWCAGQGVRNGFYYQSIGRTLRRTRLDLSLRWDEREAKGTFYWVFGFFNVGWPGGEPGPDAYLYSAGGPTGHEAANMAQHDLQRMNDRGDNPFGLPLGYQMTLEDGMLAICGESPGMQFISLWDGLLFRMREAWAKTHGQPAPTPTGPWTLPGQQTPPAPVPGPIATPPPPPAPPAPVVVALPPLTPTALRILELEKIALAYAVNQRVGPELLGALSSWLITVRPVTMRMLRDLRLARKRAMGDPRAIPPEDL